MSASTGLGLIEVHLLDAFDRCDARPNSPHVKSQRVVSALCDAAGIGPRIGYEILCDLARPYVSHLQLVDFHGNFGSPDFGPAGPRYTESRLTPLGAGALAAERGGSGALPIGLINGNSYVDGQRPPLHPERLVAALRAAADGANDDAIVDLVGLPHFPTGCQVDGDVAEFASGQATELTLEARITPIGDDQLLISHLPPGSGASEVTSSIAARIDLPSASRIPRLPVCGVCDDSAGGTETRVFVYLQPGVDPDAAIAMLRGNTQGIRRTVGIRLDGPLGPLLRSWVTEHGGDDFESRLSLVEAAIVGRYL